MSIEWIISLLTTFLQTLIDNMKSNNEKGSGWENVLDNNY